MKFLMILIMCLASTTLAYSQKVPRDQESTTNNGREEVVELPALVRDINGTWWLSQDRETQYMYMIGFYAAQQAVYDMFCSHPNNRDNEEFHEIAAEKFLFLGYSPADICERVTFYYTDFEHGNPQHPLAQVVYFVADKDYWNKSPYVEAEPISGS